MLLSARKGGREGGNECVLGMRRGGEDGGCDGMRTFLLLFNRGLLVAVMRIGWDEK
jgi:hypothetical protein